MTLPTKRSKFLGKCLLLQIIVCLALSAWYAQKLVSTEKNYLRVWLDNKSSGLDLKVSTYLSQVESIIRYIGNLSIRDDYISHPKRLHSIIKALRKQNHHQNSPLVSVRWLGVDEYFHNMAGFHKQFDQEFCYGIDDNVIKQSSIKPWKMLLGNNLKPQQEFGVSGVKLPAAFGITNNQGEYLGSFVFLIDMKGLHDEIQNMLGYDKQFSYAVFSDSGLIVAESKGDQEAQDAMNAAIADYITLVNKGIKNDERILSLSSKFSYQIRDLSIEHYNYKIALMVNEYFSPHHNLKLTALNFIALMMMCFIAFYLVKKHIVTPLVELSGLADMIALGQNVEIKHYKVEELDSLANTLGRLMNLQKQLLSANRKLEFILKQMDAVSKVKSEFMRNIQNNLCVPLHHIIGGSDYILSQHSNVLPEDCLECTKVIHKSSRELLTMITNIILVADLGSQNMKMEEEDSEISVVIKSALETSMDRVMKSRIKINLNIEKDLPLVNIDATHLETALLNIIENAINFSYEDGEISIVVRLQASGLIIIIKDTGKGIPAPQLHYINEFLTTPSSGNNLVKTNKHIGLGLTIAHNIFDLHNARMRIESIEQVGTQVCITIPNIRLVEPKIDEPK